MWETARLLLTYLQVIAGYKSLIPDFNKFIGRLAQRDQQVLRACYGLQFENL